MNKETCFHFKQFSVFQNENVMKVGTDSTLLGSLADVSKAQSILDIGTGTGILALMMAQKSNANIVAIDPSHEAYLLAQKNFTNAIWSNRIQLFELSLQDYTSQFHNRFDVIISNPPYFSPETNFQMIPSPRKTYRQNDLLHFEDFFRFSYQLATENGTLWACMHPDSAPCFIEKAEKYGWSPALINTIAYSTKKPIHLLVYKFTKTPQNCKIISNFLFDLDNQPTLFYLDQTKEFLLWKNIVKL